MASAVVSSNAGWKADFPGRPAEHAATTTQPRSQWREMDGMDGLCFSPTLSTLFMKTTCFGVEEENVYLDTGVVVPPCISVGAVTLAAFYGLRSNHCSSRNTFTVCERPADAQSACRPVAHAPVDE